MDIADPLARVAPELLLAEPHGRTLQFGAIEGSEAELRGGGHGLPPSSRPAVAYLSNVYPKISHSFIQTEIAALERQGIAVRRFTVRRADAGSDIPALREEEARTTALLEDRLALLAAVSGALVRSPGKTLGTLIAALRAGGSMNPIRAFAYFAEAALLARTLVQEGISHVHVHFGTNPATVARLAAQLAPITYSFTVHGPDEYDAPRALDLPGKIAQAAFVAGVSSFGRGQLMRWSEPSHWRRIHVVHCAPDPEFLASTDRIAGAPGKDADPAYASDRFVCVARLSAQKGLPLLLEAIRGLSRRRSMHVEIIGDGEDRAVIEAQIARLDLGDKVTLRGWADPGEVRKALHNARALVLPSFAEGLPIVLMEAMALRRPVIATAIAGIPELVDAQVGWLVPSGSVQALESAMEAALDTPSEQLMEMGRHARARVLERHDPDFWAGRLSDLLAPFAH